MGPSSSPAPLHWDTFCDVLSGASPDSIDREGFIAAGIADRGGQSDTEGISSHLAGQFLFESDPSRRTLERFWLKLNLFLMLCRTVVHEHDSTHRPILSLSPTRVRVGCHSRGGSWLPRWWQFEVIILAGPTAASPTPEGIPRAMASELVPVPDDFDRAYLSRAVRDWPLGLEMTGTALVQSVDPIPHDLDGHMQALVRIHLATEKLPAREFGMYDVFKVSLPVHGSSQTVDLWARKIDTPERGVIVSGATDLLSNDLHRLLLQMDQQVLSQTRISVFRAFPLSSDLESLALLFLRSLLAPHPQEFLSTSNTMRELLNRIAPAVEGVDPEDAFTVHTRVREYFREMEPMFRNPGVPDDLWFDSLILVARCLSEVHGFGLCHTVGGSMGQERSGPLRVVLHEVANLAARARVALFDTEERDAIIRMTCEGMLAEIDRSGRGSRQ